MGTILPNSVTNPQTTPAALPSRALFNNGNVNWGAALGDVGDILRGLGGPAGSWDPILQQRAREDDAIRAQAINNQRYQDELKEQQFKNNLAAQTLRVKMMQVMGRAGGLNNDFAAPTAIFGDTRINRNATPNTGNVAITPLANTLGQLTDSSNAIPVQANADNVNLSPLSNAGKTNLPLTQTTTPVSSTNSIAEHKNITPDNLPDNIKKAYNQFATYHPELAEGALQVANYQLTPLQLNQLVAKQYKDPQEIQAVQRLVRIINPNYDPNIVQKVQNFQKDLNNPKGLAANLKTLRELQDTNLDLQEMAKKLPGTTSPFVNAEIAQRAAGWLGNQNLRNYNLLLDTYAKPLERYQIGGKATNASLTAAKQQLDPSFGADTNVRLLREHQKIFDRQVLDIINSAYQGTNGVNGIPQNLLSQATLDRLQKGGLITIRNDGTVIPALSRQQTNNYYGLGSNI